MATFHRYQGERGGEERIEIQGRFDFKSHRDWRALVDELDPASSYVVDMSHTSFIDSSALGMLLMLRDRIAGIRIVGPNEDVRAIFDIARFDQVFLIEPAA
ncbi:MAG: STAS domain-containing protein [Myxococcota bacterium]